MMRSIYLHPYFRKRWPVLVMAHRGGGGLAPENTMTAFEQAVAMGVDVLELDVRATADGALVVIHDATVGRTTDGRGAVHQLTLAQLQQLDAGYQWTADGGRTYPFRGRGITVPTLRELFTAFPQTRMNIDLKQKEPPIVDAFARLLVAYEMVDQVLVGSFHDEALYDYRCHLPAAVTAAGRRETLIFFFLQWARLSWPYRPAAQAFQIPERHGPLRIGPRFVQAALRREMEVHVWTVNDVADMQRLIRWGVAGIITDYPDRLLQLVAGERAALQR